VLALRPFLPATPTIRHPRFSVCTPSGWVGDRKLRHVPANRTKPLPANANLATRVQASIDALTVGPADSGLVGLALTLARSIDEMDAETRGRMLGQTSGALLHVLKELRQQAVPKPWSKWDEMKPGAVTARGIGGR
jgi:hypothetical protein